MSQQPPNLARPQPRALLSHLKATNSNNSNCKNGSLMIIIAMIITKLTIRIAMIVRIDLLYSCELCCRSRYNHAFQSSIFEPPEEQLQSNFVPAGKRRDQTTAEIFGSYDEKETLR